MGCGCGKKTPAVAPAVQAANSGLWQAMNPAGQMVFQAKDKAKARQQAEAFGAGSGAGIMLAGNKATFEPV